MKLGAKIKDRTVVKSIAGLAPHLYAGEEITLLVRTNKTSPVLDMIAVTNARVLGFYVSLLPARPPKISISADEIADANTNEKRYANPTVSVVTADGEEISLGRMTADKSDGLLLVSAIVQLREKGAPPDVPNVIADLPQATGVEAIQQSTSTGGQVWIEDSRVSDPPAPVPVVPAIPPMPAAEPLYSTPGWRFLLHRSAIGYFDGSRWQQSVELPTSVHGLSNRELRKFLKVRGVRWTQRDDLATRLREADLRIRRHTLRMGAETDFVEALLEAARTGFRGPLVREGNVQLVESRKGARVSERNGRSSHSSSGSSFGFKGVSVGGGGGSSSSFSRTVSYPAPDELRVIDRGSVVVTINRITFAGPHFTKNAPAGRIADLSFDMAVGSAVVHPVTGMKTWHLLGLSPLAIMAMCWVWKLSANDLKQIAADPGIARNFTGVRNDGDLQDDVDRLQEAVDLFSGLLPDSGGSSG